MARSNAHRESWKAAREAEQGRAEQRWCQRRHTAPSARKLATGKGVKERQGREIKLCCRIWGCSNLTKQPGDPEEQQKAPGAPPPPLQHALPASIHPKAARSNAAERQGSC